MRSFHRPWAAVALVAVLLGACADGDDGDSSSPSEVSEASEPAATSTVTDVTTTGSAVSTTTAATATSGQGDGALGDEEARERTLEVMGGIVGGQALDADEQDCLVQATVADDDLRQALLDDADFEALSPDTRERVAALVVDCAPRPIARAVVDAIDLDVDAAAATCLEDGLATDPGLLGDLAVVGIATDAGALAGDVPTDLVLELLGLVERCGIPLSALS